MKTKLELYTEWREDAQTALEKQELDVRWLIRESLRDKANEQILGQIQSAVKDQKRYIAFLDEVIAEQEKEVASELVKA